MNKKYTLIFSSISVLIFVCIFCIIVSTSLNDIENKIITAQTDAILYESTNQEEVILDESIKSITSESNYTVLNKTSNKYINYINSIIQNNIQPNMTDYEKIKVIHDYIIINTSYDVSSDLPNTSFSPEGVFKLGIAVCQGYAEAFQLIMETLGIPCKIVKGSANNISHAWNVVKVNGEWYHIDVTWDDPIIENQIVNGTDNLSYSYFLKSDSIFYQDHIATSNPPSCMSNKYLYIEQYYNVPYTILNTVNDIPDKFMEYYNNGIKSLTLYFPEDIDPAQTDLLKELYKMLYKQTGTMVTFKYYPVSRYIDYSYITIFIQ